jgi:hypothetical protein
MITGAGHLENRHPAPRAVGGHLARQQIAARPVHPVAGTPLGLDFAGSDGQRSLPHARMTASLLGVAGRICFRSLPLISRKSPLRWAEWSHTPNAAWITVATHLVVHTLPGNPWAPAPGSSKRTKRGFLRGIQPACQTSRQPVDQPLGPSFARPLEPLIDRARCGAQRLRDHAAARACYELGTESTGHPRY